MFNNYILLWATTKVGFLAIILLYIGALLFPWLFGVAYLALTIYSLTLLLWTTYQRRKSKKWGLKVIYLIPCEHWLINWLAEKKGITIPKGRVWEMHLDTKISYSSDCNQARAQFQKDIDHDLLVIFRLITNNKIGNKPIITLNTFNRYWLTKTKEILGGATHRGIVLTETSCNRYKPKKHLKKFKKMFPACNLTKPGRHHPEQWQLIVS